MTFDLSEYVDVAERIRVFKEKYPEGSLQSELTLINGDGPAGWLCKAFAYRSDQDSHPGIGHAFEPIPGKTPYTRDSEAMNAETSAWGRAIVALGFETKKIASAEEVRNRSTDDNPVAKAQAAQEANHPNGQLPSEVRIHFGKNGPREDEPLGTPLGALTPAQLKWYAVDWEVKPDASPRDARLKMAAVALKAGNDTPDFDLPF